MPAVLKDPNNILSKRVVFFDYDSFVVREEFKPLIEAHAKYLAQNRNMKNHAPGSHRRARLARIQTSRSARSAPKP
jgi:hypothetical protein